MLIVFSGCNNPVSTKPKLELDIDITKTVTTRPAFNPLCQIGIKGFVRKNRIYLWGPFLNFGFKILWCNRTPNGSIQNIIERDNI